MASIANILIVLGVCAIVGTYVGIVLALLRESERGTQAPAQAKTVPQARHAESHFADAAAAGAH